MRIKETKKFYKEIWNKILLVIMSLSTLIPLSPLVAQGINRDSGVFLYIGWRMLYGEVPYRDIWDHKPPVIYFINWLGQVITPGSTWGIWIIEAAFLVATMLLAYHLLKRYFDQLAIIISGFLFLITLFFLLQGGNLTTEYSLLFQMMTFLLAIKILPETFRFSHGFFFGALGALTFLTKQPAIGVFVACGIYLLIQRLKTKAGRQLGLEIMAITGGFLAIFALISVYFLANSAFSQFISAAFTYNFAYSSGDIFVRLYKLKFIFDDIDTTGLLVIAMIGFSVFIIRHMTKQHKEENFLPLLWIAAINFPIEILMVNISTRSYQHYFMTFLPVLLIFSTYAISMITNNLQVLSRKPLQYFLSSIAVIGLLFWAFAGDIIDVLNYYRTSFNQQKTITQRIMELSPDRSETVLFWGAENAIDFLNGRISPTRFVYLYPLTRCNYVDVNMVNDFLDELLANPPVLLIDTHDNEAPFGYLCHQADPIIQQKSSQVLGLYSPLENIAGWDIYQLSTTP